MPFIDRLEVPILASVTTALPITYDDPAALLEATRHCGGGPSHLRKQVKIGLNCPVIVADR
jgi:hypothetical protein